MSNSFITFNSKELPSGWLKVKLPTIADIIMGQSPPSSTYNEFCDGLPFFQGKTEFGKLYPSVVKYCTQPKKIAETGDILISVRAPVGPTNLCQDKAAIGRGLAAIRPLTVISTFYLLFYLRSIEESLSEQGTGSTFTAISKSHLNNLDIIIAPLKEQRRMVAKLEKLLGKVDTCKQRLEKIPTILTRFRQSVLAAACSGRLTADWREQNESNDFEEDVPWHWKKVNLDDVVASLHQGWSPKCELHPSPSEEIWGVIKTTAVQPLVFVDQENKQLPDYLEPRPELEIRENDILITRAGPRVRAGVSCLVSSTRSRLIICDKVYRLRVKKNKISAAYLVYFLNSPSTIYIIDELKTGISDSGVNLTQKKFLALTLWIPHLAEQQEIVRRVEALFQKADRIQQRYEKAKAHIDQLTQSILAKAFRGELVPQDPNDEPASVLLDRIREERANQPQAKTAKKSTEKTPKATGKRGRKKAQPPEPPESDNAEPIQLKLPGIE
ncbi:restriction endonuclease subunit S [Laspinema sp. A4]|uniref:restriction endonuclease subunit S n=1 Tax=Laspinema sp. D2d TaxID=2953686 RepID=UPI0021BBB51E|nr:restriction endonuclease subunit S [Laspinema sp. D2d]MCT7982878.1 restriction endonuclease subunit S [Laspinema sp. D2d]